jgi:hypothetical protein
MRDDGRLSAAERRQFDEIIEGFDEREPYHRDAAAEARIAAARLGLPGTERPRRWPRRRRSEPQ